MSVQRRIAVLSIATGAIVAASFFVFTLATILAVRGDGTAPEATHWALQLIALPAALMGISNPSVPLACIFWGMCAAIGVYAVLQLIQRAR